MLFNIHNPTAARRIIYDGSLAQRRIEIGPGETKYNVAVEPHIAAGFSDGRSGDKSDLWLTPVDAAPNPPPPSPVQVAPPRPEPAPTPKPAPPLPQPDEDDEDDDEVVAAPPPPVTPQPSYKRYQAPLIEDPIEKAIAAEAEEEHHEVAAKTKKSPQHRPAKKKRAGSK